MRRVYIELSEATIKFSGFGVSKINLPPGFIALVQRSTNRTSSSTAKCSTT